MLISERTEQLQNARTKRNRYWSMALSGCCLKREVAFPLLALTGWVLALQINEQQQEKKERE
jgi:hypothetical protein